MRNGSHRPKARNKATGNFQINFQIQSTTFWLTIKIRWKNIPWIVSKSPLWRQRSATLTGRLAASIQFS
jgi:hypothetical protein